MEIRTLTERDIPQLKTIWKEIFGDSDHFIDWYFQNRFFPEYSVCACTDERILSVCHTLPSVMWIREKKIPCALLNGVATLPEFRGQGLMKRQIAFLYDLLPQKNICLLPNTPVDLRIYAPCGHYANTSAVCLNRAESRKMPKELNFCEISEHLAEIEQLYHSIAPRYCGILARTTFEIFRKCDEYLLDHCKLLLHENGYAIYCDTEDSCLCTEILARNTQTYRTLIDGLFAHAFPKKLTGKFPPDAFPNEQGTPRSVLGILDVKMFLETLGLQNPITLKVTDSFRPENSGIYLLNGSDSCMPPQITLSIGALAQWLSGYCDLAETDAVIHEKPANLPKKQLCFTNDDY